MSFFKKIVKALLQYGPLGFIRKAMRKVSRIVLLQFNIDSITKFKIHKIPSLTHIGSHYGGWIVPSDLFDEESICYCAGVGEDITFDIGLIKRFDCKVFAFDPTPRAIDHVGEEADDLDRYKFFPWGLWDENTEKEFYAPQNPSHVSHSILNLQSTDSGFTAEVKRLSNIMDTLGHDELDLLIIDIEGAEYKVINSIVEDNLDIKVLCVEYDEVYNPLDRDYVSRIKKSLSKLRKSHYKIVASDNKGNYTLVREDIYEDLTASR